MLFSKELSFVNLLSLEIPIAHVSRVSPFFSSFFRIVSFFPEICLRSYFFLSSAYYCTISLNSSVSTEIFVAFQCPRDCYFKRNYYLSICYRTTFRSRRSSLCFIIVLFLSCPISTDISVNLKIHLFTSYPNERSNLSWTSDQSYRYCEKNKISLSYERGNSFIKRRN